MNPPLRGPRLVAAAVALTLALGGCGKPADCPRCETLVIAALGEPDHLLSPFVWQSVGRDIGDLVYERLAILDPVRAPLDSTAYRAGLAERWERVDSLTWLFHLRPDARWQDGVAVTASDVVFSFEAHQDSALDAANRAALSDLRATTEDDRTVRIAFQSYRPDQLYDATSHVRVFPRHVWDSVPRDRWGASADPARLTGSGPYRVAEWRRGQLLTLEAVSASAPIRRITWQFAQGPDALTNLVLSGDVDLVETLPDQARLAEVSRAPHLKVISTHRPCMASWDSTSPAGADGTTFGCAGRSRWGWTGKRWSGRYSVREPRCLTVRSRPSCGCGKRRRGPKATARPP